MHNTPEPALAMPTSGLKRLGIGVAAAAAVVAIAVGAVAAVPLFVSEEAIRKAVKAEIRSATGFDPVMRGEVSLSPFPSSAASFSDVVLGAASGTPPLAARQLQAQLKFLPLLLGRVEVAQVALIEPALAIEFDAAGRSNWAGLLTSLSRRAPRGGNDGGRVSFSEIRLVGGSISVRDAATGLSEELEDVNFSLAWPAISASLGGTGAFIWRGERVDASVALSDFRAALSGERAGLKARVTSSLLRLAFDGHIGRLPTLKVEGALSADSASLRRALMWAGQRSLPGSGLGAFAVKAQTSLVGDVFSLTNLNLEIDGNHAEGVITLAGGKRPLLQGTLAADKVDVSPYVADVRLLGGGGDRSWSRLPITLEGFSSLDFDLRLSASRVSLGEAQAGRTAIGVSLHDGRLALAIGESHAFGGVLKGGIGLGKGVAGAEVKAELQFVDVDLESCLRAVFGVGRLAGRGNLSLALEASGENVAALSRAVNGSGRLTASKGSLSGLNIEQLLRRLERRPLSGTGDFRSGRTPFESLAVDLKIEQGKALIESVDLDASALRLAIDGSASIPARQLDLKGVASLAPAANDQAFELPFVVRGSWDNPMMLPDVPSLIRRSGAAAPLLDAVRSGSAREAVRSVIEQVTRGADPAPPPAAPPSAAPPPAAPPPAAGAETDEASASARP